MTTIRIVAVAVSATFGSRVWLQKSFYVAVLELLDDICLKSRFCLDSWQMLCGFYFARHFNSQHGEMEMPELASSALTLYGSVDWSPCGAHSEHEQRAPTHFVHRQFQ